MGPGEPLQGTPHPQCQKPRWRTSGLASLYKALHPGGGEKPVPFGREQQEICSATLPRLQKENCILGSRTEAQSP